MRVIKNSVVFGDTVLPAPLIVGVELRRAFSFHTLFIALPVAALTWLGVMNGLRSHHDDEVLAGVFALLMAVLIAVFVAPSHRLLAFLSDGRRVPGPVFFLAANARIAKNLLLTELAKVDAADAVQEAISPPKPPPSAKIESPPLERPNIPPGAIKTRETHVERQVVVSRCKFCNKLTPVDADACSHCGAANFLR